MNYDNYNTDDINLIKQIISDDIVGIIKYYVGLNGKLKQEITKLEAEIKIFE